MRNVSETGLTLQDSELGAGVDLSHAVGGRAFVDGFVAVGPQRLDTQHRAVVELRHLARRQRRRITASPGTFLFKLMLAEWLSKTQRCFPEQNTFPFV